MFDAFRDLWCQFADEGRISADEYQRMTLPQYYNSVEEFSAPLTDTASAAHQAGLRLESIETRVVECPFKADFLKHGDAEHFATNYVLPALSGPKVRFTAPWTPRVPLLNARGSSMPTIKRMRITCGRSPMGMAWTMSMLTS